MLWVRGPLSVLERLSIVSHLRNGHPVRLFSYDRIADLPAGAIWEDARAILPESAVVTSAHPESHGSLAVFSNLFRYTLLLERGGIWSDCDSVLLKPLDFADSMEYFFSSEPARKAEADGRQPARVNIGAIKVPAGAPLMRYLVDAVSAQDIAKTEWNTTGPSAMHHAASTFGLLDRVLAPEVFCPIAWWDMPRLIAGTADLPSSTYAVHFWNEMWRRNFFDKNAVYDPLSLFERLKAHYLHD